MFITTQTALSAPQHTTTVPPHIRRRSEQQTSSTLTQQGSTRQGKPCCDACLNTVYQFEKIAVDGRSFHPSCFRCNVCKRLLNLSTYGTQCWELVEAPIGLDHDLAREGVYRSVIYCQKHVPSSTAGALKGPAQLALDYPLVEHQLDDLAPLSVLLQRKKQDKDIKDEVKKEEMEKEEVKVKLDEKKLEGKERIQSTLQRSRTVASTSSNRKEKTTTELKPLSALRLPQLDSMSGPRSAAVAALTSSSPTTNSPFGNNTSTRSPIGNTQNPNLATGSTRTSLDFYHIADAYMSTPHTPQSPQSQSLNRKTLSRSNAARRLTHQREDGGSPSSSRISSSLLQSAHESNPQFSSSSENAQEMNPQLNNTFMLLCKIHHALTHAEEERRIAAGIRNAAEAEHLVHGFLVYTHRQLSLHFTTLVIPTASTLLDPAFLTSCDQLMQRYTIFCMEASRWINERSAQQTVDQRLSAVGRHLEQLREFYGLILRSLRRVSVAYARQHGLQLVAQVPGWCVESADARGPEIEDGEQLGTADNLTVDSSLVKQRKKEKKKQKSKQKGNKEDPAGVLLERLQERFGAMSLSGVSGKLGDQKSSTDSLSIPLTLQSNMDCFDFSSLTYRLHFLPHPHRHYFGTVPIFGSIVLTIMRDLHISTDSSLAASNPTLNAPPNILFGFRVLLRCHAVPGLLLDLSIKDSDLTSPSKSFFATTVTPPPTLDLEEITEKTWKSVLHTLMPSVDPKQLVKVDIPASKAALNDDIELQQDAEGSKTGSHDAIQTLQPNPSQDYDKLRKSVLQLDEYRTAFHYKFGLLYVVDGQTNEKEWFNNRVDYTPSSTVASFSHLCDTLGTVIALQGHSGFSAGLDTKRGNTGQTSIYTRQSYKPSQRQLLDEQEEDLDSEQKKEKEYCLDFEIMFHVSTMLPFIDNDEQQIQRKRHIGNDLVSLVFMEGPTLNQHQLQLMEDNVFQIKTPFDPSKIKSQFLHVYIVVQAIPWPSSGSPTSASTPNSVVYRVSVTSAIDVPPFSPYLPDPPIFHVNTNEERNQFKRFLLAKLMNAENAAYEAVKFRTLHHRTHAALIESLVKDRLSLDQKHGNRSAKDKSIDSLRSLKDKSTENLHRPTKETSKSNEHVHRSTTTKSSDQIYKEESVPDTGRPVHESGDTLNVFHQIKSALSKSNTNISKKESEQLKTEDSAIMRMSRKQVE